VFFFFFFLLVIYRAPRVWVEMYTLLYRELNVQLM
jgi:hypothetical protein